MQNKIAVSDEQATAIAEILMQYAPEGWTKLTMLFKTNAELTQIDSWAETPQTAEHGFQLDDGDADAIETILGEVWKQSGRAWNVAEYSVDDKGNYTISFE